MPNNAEWQALGDFVGEKVAGKKLKARSGWNDHGKQPCNGTDNYGFSALPGGLYSGGEFGDASHNGYWWSASENDADVAYSQNIYYNYEGMGYNDNDKSYGFSVRCVQD